MILLKQAARRTASQFRTPPVARHTWYRTAVPVCRAALSPSAASLATLCVDARFTVPHQPHHREFATHGGKSRGARAGGPARRVPPKRRVRGGDGDSSGADWAGSAAGRRGKGGGQTGGGRGGKGAHSGRGGRGGRGGHRTGSSSRKGARQRGKRSQQTTFQPPTVPRELSLPDKLTVKQLARLAGISIEDTLNALEAVGGLVDLEDKTNSSDATTILDEIGADDAGRGGGRPQRARRKRGRQGTGFDHIFANTLLDVDTAELLALELGFQPKRIMPRTSDAVIAPRPTSLNDLPRRAPIVSVMGHVDHGKTTLLDKLRGTQNPVAGTEAGGITQAIGAFRVYVDGDTVIGEHPVSDAKADAGVDSDTVAPFITFIDTPGHAAFSAMRSRGAVVTDIVVLVVAATEGLMPQSLEVVELARDSAIPLVVAVTKVDVDAMSGGDGSELQDALSRIERQLLEAGIATEAMGGDVQLVPCSGITGEGLGDLTEAILLQAEMADPPLRAAMTQQQVVAAAVDMDTEQSLDVNRKMDIDPPAADGVVLEALVVKGLGTTVNALVCWGELLKGDHIVIGTEWGRIRSLMDEHGVKKNRAGPSTPVQITGMRGIPSAGDEIVVVPNEARARAVSELRTARAAWELEAAHAEAEAAARMAAQSVSAEAAQEAMTEAQEQAEQELAELDEQDGGAAALARLRARRAARNAAQSANAAHALDQALADESNITTAVLDMSDPEQRGRTWRARRRKSARALELVRATKAEMAKKSLEPGDEGYVPPRVPLLLKCESDGMLAVLRNSVQEMPSTVVQPVISRDGVGPVSDSDVQFAVAAGASIFAFGVNTPASVRKSAEQNNVPVHHHSVIYHFQEQLKDELVKNVAPVMRPAVDGQAEVLELFEIQGRGRANKRAVAGCTVTDGELKRASSFRVLRPRSDGTGKSDTMFEVKEAHSLRHFKDMVEVVKKGQECGIDLDSADIRIGDIIQAFHLEPRKVDVYGKLVGHAAQK